MDGQPAGKQQASSEFRSFIAKFDRGSYLSAYGTEAQSCFCATQARRGSRRTEATEQSKEQFFIFNKIATVNNGISIGRSRNPGKSKASPGCKS